MAGDNSGIAYAEIRADITKLDGDLEKAREKILAAVTELQANVEIIVSANTSAAETELKALQAQTEVLAAEPTVITPLVNDEEALAALTALDASAAAIADVPPVITPIVDGEPAILEIEAVTAAAAESAAAPVIITVEAPTVPAVIAELEAVKVVQTELATQNVVLNVERGAVDTAAVSSNTLRDAFRGLSAGSREVSAVLNGSVSGAARAASTGISASSSSLGILGIAVGVVALALPKLISAFSGLSDTDARIKADTDLVSAALDKNTTAFLNNKKAVEGITDGADAVVAAQQQIDDALLHTQGAGDKTAQALGAIGKTVTDIQSVIGVTQNLTSAQIDAAAAINKAVTGQDLGEANAKKLAEAQQIAAQISGLNRDQQQQLAALSQGFLTSVGTFADDSKQVLLASGLTTKQINDYTTSIRQLQNVANAVDLSSIISQSLQVQAGQSKAFDTALKLAEAQTGFNTQTTDSTQIQVLYAKTIEDYSNAQNTAAASTKASEEADKAAAKAAADGTDAKAQAKAATDLLTQSAEQQLAAAAEAAKQTDIWNKAIEGLETPAERAATALDDIKKELDGLSNKPLDLAKSQEAVTKFFADLQDKKNKNEKFVIGVGFDTNTVGGSNNFDILTKGIATFRDNALAAFAEDGDSAKAVASYTGKIDLLRQSFIDAAGPKGAKKAAADFDAAVNSLNLEPISFKAALDQGSIDALRSEVAKLPDDVSPDTKIQLGILLQQGKLAEVQAGLDALKNDPATGAARVADIFAKAEGVPNANAEMDTIPAKQRNAIVTAQPVDIPKTDALLNDLAAQARIAHINAQAETASADAALSVFTGRERDAITIPVHADTRSFVQAVTDAVLAAAKRSVVIPIKSGTATSETGNYFQKFDRGGVPGGELSRTASHYVDGTRNQYMYGEPSTNGEFFISMNPVYKELNRNLLTAAASRLGMSVGNSTPTSIMMPHFSALLDKVSTMVDHLDDIANTPHYTITPIAGDPDNAAAKMWHHNQSRRAQARVG